MGGGDNSAIWGEGDSGHPEIHAAAGLRAGAGPGEGQREVKRCSGHIKPCRKRACASCARLLELFFQ